MKGERFDYGNGNSGTVDAFMPGGNWPLHLGEPGHRYILGVDPGLNHLGLAWIDETTGLLLRAELREVPAFAGVPKDLVASLVLTEADWENVAQGVVEWPTHGRRGNQATISQLGWLCGAICGRWGARRAPVQHMSTTGERSWCGGVPKEVRHRRLVEAAEKSELEVINALDLPDDLEHNVLDAWDLARWLWRA